MDTATAMRDAAATAGVDTHGRAGLVHQVPDHRIAIAVPGQPFPLELPVCVVPRLRAELERLERELWRRDVLVAADYELPDGGRIPPLGAR